MIEEDVIFDFQKKLKKNNPKKQKQLGVFYTPQEVVDFMVNSVNDILKKEFKIRDGIADVSVKLLDPFVGTGAYPLGIIRKLEEEFGNDNESKKKIKDNLLPRLEAWDIMPEALDITKKNVANLLDCSESELSFENKDTFEEY